MTFNPAILAYFHCLQSFPHGNLYENTVEAFIRHHPWKLKEKLLEPVANENGLLQATKTIKQKGTVAYKSFMQNVCGIYDSST